MKVKDFINETKPKLQNNDLLLIYGFEILPSGDEINHYIEIPQDLKKWPKLNEIEILRTHEYKINFSNINLHGQELNNGHALEYCGIVDYNEIRKAKGLKPIKYITKKTNKAHQDKKRFTL